MSTGCGDARFWDHGTFGPDFNTILQRAAQRSPVGKWTVKVGDIGWIYTFMAGTDFSSGPAAWQSFGGALAGIGSWKVDTTLHIDWAIGTIEEWNFPLSSTAEQGTLVKQGAGPYGSKTDKPNITASRMDLAHRPSSCHSRSTMFECRDSQKSRIGNTCGRSPRDRSLARESHKSREATEGLRSAQRATIGGC